MKDEQEVRLAHNASRNEPFGVLPWMVILLSVGFALLALYANILASH